MRTSVSLLCSYWKNNRVSSRKVMYVIKAKVQNDYEKNLSPVKQHSNI